MTDQSEKDKKYFIDEHVYNCPFCKRRNVSYWVYNSFDFDWTNNKKCYGYIVRCSSCKKESMHLSNKNINIRTPAGWSVDYGNFSLSDELDTYGEELDNCFFYSVPSSFFVVDTRIPKELRELITEAENCLKSNLLTGASACARKVVYELCALKGAKGDRYEDKIKSLKEIESEIDPTYFDILLTIQQATSSKVHEESYDGWDAPHLRLIISSLIEILNEIYVVPAVREEQRNRILEMKKEVLDSK